MFFEICECDRQAIIPPGIIFCFLIGMRVVVSFVEGKKSVQLGQRDQADVIVAGPLGAVLKNSSLQTRCLITAR